MVVATTPGTGTAGPGVQSLDGKTILITGGGSGLRAALLQDPAHVAAAVRSVLLTPGESVVPEITILPMQERSWP